MHVYTTGQWVLLFFFYCLCGWVWESCYTIEGIFFFCI